MAVIIPNMDMPNSCGGCILRPCCAGYGVVFPLDKRGDKCPLKSADEMVEEITRRSELKSNRSVLTATAYIDCLQIIDKYIKE